MNPLLALVVLLTQPPCDCSTRSCESEGFAGGKLSCTAECVVDVAACQPCLANKDVTCVELPGADLLTPGAGRGLVTWRASTSLEGAVVTSAGARRFDAPLGEKVTTWAARWDVGWTLWFVSEGVLYEKRILESGKTFPPRRLVEVKEPVELLPLHDTRQFPFLVAVQGDDTRPKVFPIVRSQAQAESPVERPLLGRVGTRTWAVVPHPGAGEGEADLDVVSVEPSVPRTTAAHFKGPRGFGSTSADEREVDLTYKNGHLEAKKVGNAFVTTWTPKHGAKTVLEEGGDGVFFAKHPAVTAVQVERAGSGPFTLASATFQSHVWVALRFR